jgi:hypothetical protein
MRMPRKGEGWRHYEGGYQSLYEIVGTGHDTETGHAVVVYQRYRSTLAQDQVAPELWVRPLDVFLGYTDDHKRRFAFEREAPEPEAHPAPPPDSGGITDRGRGGI